MGRKPCCSKEGLNRGAWTAMEDEILVSYINRHGEGKWGSLPKRAGLKRCGKSCRLRWLNYLRPGIKRGNISDDEEELIVRLHRLLGNRWSLIAGRLPGRTDNEIKNYWNTTLSKRMLLTARGTNQQQQQASTPKPPHSSSVDAPPDHPDTSSSPIRTKATRCTAMLPAHHDPIADQVVQETTTTHIEQQQRGLDGDEDLSIELDFEGIELGFLLSPWRVSADGDRHELGDCGTHEADLEELLGLGPDGAQSHGGVPSLGDLELPWL
ncbi:transcription repressor MYB6 [Brachypodium distachyon]|uniref:Uncharacterized protein n=1 Tax=Brachypodium distachyon TaxID=15368 RepID=A0A0Q3HEZ4_BRADI|nr:transcription repressor MYB6 [Brachypodium distachyon]KQK21312.1 hypothetical protein BRADI_1g60106v3 [Brachypodium distachyon]|eukprot:XP_003561552.1 transcription repressor MYB6 [Brachypodium distachyon]